MRRLYWLGEAVIEGREVSLQLGMAVTEEVRTGERRMVDFYGAAYKDEREVFVKDSAAVLYL